MTKEEIREKLILALDFEDSKTALTWVDKTREWIGLYKVGSILFTRCGPSIVQEIHRQGSKVFLDLKFHDIPNTVAGCAKAAVELGVAMFNVHASGGAAMMRQCAQAAREHAKKSGKPAPILLAVTVLTSLDDKILKEEIGTQHGVTQQVEHFAALAKQAGLDGVVASPLEISRIRKIYPSPFKILTPGIRSQDDPPDDQKRTLTAAEALTLGADYLVLGRTITAKSDPAGALGRISRSTS